jgi:hypothetical protein
LQVSRRAFIQRWTATGFVYPVAGEALEAAAPALHGQNGRATLRNGSSCAESPGAS